MKLLLIRLQILKSEGLGFFKMRTLSSVFFSIVCTLSFGQIPTNYYVTASGKTGNSLKTALRDITKTGHVKLPYTSTAFDVWDAFAYTDVRPAPQNNLIWDMYSDVPNGTPLYNFTLYTNQCGTASVEGDCYSREHNMPNSWWGGLDNASNPQYSDLHHLFPADQYVNLKKSDNPLGQTNLPTWVSTNGSKVGPCSVPGYSGTIFEPINEYKGDFARAQLYLATRYMDVIGTWVKSYPTTEARFVIDSLTNDFKPWFINMLIQWHVNDPVSQKEINRNNSIYYNTPQHNRNPFIDHPEYVCMIWGGSICNSPPVISGITVSNTSPNQFDTVSVTTSVADDGSVSDVLLKWGTDSMNLNNTISMTLYASNNYRTITPIPAQIGPLIYFKILATDNLSNATTSSLKLYTVTFLNLKAEPSFYPKNIKTTILTSNTINIDWTDPIAGELPDGYLVKVYRNPSVPMLNPVDGIPESNDSTAFVVLPGYQSKIILNVIDKRLYTIRIYPFTNYGSYINYKSDGLVPSVQYINKCNCGEKKTLFFETFGKETTSILNTKFSSNNLLFSGTTDIISAIPSTGYSGASGNSNVFITNTIGKYIEISGINTSGMNSPLLYFGIYKSTDSSNGSDLVLETSCDGINYIQVPFTSLLTGTGTAGWQKVSTIGLIALCPNLHIRFRQNGSTTQFRIDDVYLVEGGN